MNHLGGSYVPTVEHYKLTWRLELLYGACLNILTSLPQHPLVVFFGNSQVVGHTNSIFSLSSIRALAFRPLFFNADQHWPDHDGSTLRTLCTYYWGRLLG